MDEHTMNQLLHTMDQVVAKWERFLIQHRQMRQQLQACQQQLEALQEENRRIRARLATHVSSDTISPTTIADADATITSGQLEQCLAIVEEVLDLCRKLQLQTFSSWNQ